MKNYKKIIIGVTLLSFSLVVLVFTPYLSKAQNALGVPCDPAEPDTWDTSTGCLDSTGVDINTGTAAPNPNATAAPAPASPPGGLVPCGKGNSAPCQFNDFMTLINNVIKFVLFGMAIPIAAIMFAYAGFLMVTSGGSSEAKTKAKHIFTNVALGLAIAVASWVIIRTILVIVGFKGSWIGF